MKIPPYEPVGRCIYCGKTAAEAGMAKLQEEHIIAYSLGGVTVLPEASCNACAVETGAYEGWCAGEMFKIARYHFGWKSRKSKPPKTLPIEDQVEKGKMETRQIPATELPIAMHLPRFTIPDRLTGLVTKPGNMTGNGIWSYIAPNFQEKINKRGGTHKVNTPFRLEKLCPMLAKIAHSFTVASLGIDGFEPFLNDITLSKTDNWADFIGSPQVEVFWPENDLHGRHGLHLSYDGNLIIVWIRLFVGVGAYPYMVLSGTKA